jgi:hypothetical protein
MITHIESASKVILESVSRDPSRTPAEEEDPELTEALQFAWDFLSC